jgi:hypothetical protein
MKFKHTSAFSRRDAPELCSKDLNLRVELIDRRMDHQRIVDKRGHLNAALGRHATGKPQHLAAVASRVGPCVALVASVRTAFACLANER